MLQGSIREFEVSRMTSLLGYLFDGLLNISKARMMFKEHCVSFSLQSKR